METEIEPEEEVIEVSYPIIINDTIWRTNLYDYDLTGDEENDISLLIERYSGAGGATYNLLVALQGLWSVKTFNHIDSICYIENKTLSDNTCWITGAVFNCYLRPDEEFLRLDTNKLVRIFKDEELLDNTIYNLPEKFPYFPKRNADGTPYNYAILYRSNQVTGIGCQPLDQCTPLIYYSSFRELEEGIIVFENNNKEKYGLKIERIKSEIVVHEVQKINW